MPQEEQRDSTLLHNPFTIKELQDKYPYVQWLEYITAILPKDVKVDQNEIINVRVPKFFDRLGKVLQKTPKRSVLLVFCL